MDALDYAKLPASEWCRAATDTELAATLELIARQNATGINFNIFIEAAARLRNTAGN